MSDEEDFGGENFDEDFGQEEEQPEDFSAEPAEEGGSSLSANLTENPLVKLGVLSLVIVSVVVGFLMFSSEEEKDLKTVVRAGNTAGVEYMPGKEKLDPAYKKALEESNKQQAVEASKTGESALPAPTEVNKEDEDKNSSDLANGSEKDPLEEWRLSADRRKLNDLNAGKKGIGEDSEANKNCTPTIDQCRDLMKDAGLLEEMCSDALKDAGILDKMCKDMLKNTNVLDEMCRDKMTKDPALGAMSVDQCKKLLADMGILGAEGVLSSAVAKVCPEGFLCDKDGNVMLDANGNPIRTVDANGNKVCPTGFLCDKDGNVMRDANGNPIKAGVAKVCPEGVLCDKDGNVMLDANGNPILLGADGLGGGGVASFVDPLKAGNGAVAASNPEEVKALTEQMRAILGTIVPEELKQEIITVKKSLYGEMQEQVEAAKAAALVQGGGTTTTTTATAGGAYPAATTPTTTAAAATTDKTDEEKAKEKPIVMPGEIFYAQTLTEVNSDVESGVLATILTGPFAGAKVLGSFTLAEEKLLLTFDSVIKDDVSYKINGVALDQKTSLPGIATEVESHYFERIVLPAAAKFIEGYSAAIAETGTTTEESSSGNTQTTEKPEASPKESMYAGFEEAASIVADEVAKSADKPVTVKIKRGTTFGVLMLKKVTVGDAM